MRLQVIKNVVVKSVLWGTVSIILAFIVLTSLLRVPKVQTQIANRLTETLSQKTGFKFELGYINLNWFDDIVLKDLSVRDLEDSTMILIPEASVNFRVSSFINKSHRKLDAVTLTRAEVSLYKYKLDEPINITQFVDTLKYLLSGDGNSRFSINEIELEGSVFNFRNYTTSQSYPGFDLNKFQIDQFGGKLHDFLVRSDTITFIAEGLTGIETKTNEKIDRLDMDFIVYQKSMGLRDLNLKIGKSQLKDSIVFNYSRMSNLSYFIDSVEVIARLDGSSIYTEDLQYFASYFRGIDDHYIVSGLYRGNAPDFTVRDLDLSFQNGSHLVGTLNFTGLPNLEETFLGIRLKDSYVIRLDMQKYLSKNILNKISSFNQSNFSGSFTGFLNDFVAYGNFQTNLGNFESDINIKIGKDITTYSGNLITRNFNIRKFSGIEFLNKINMSGTITGSGLTKTTADFVLDGIISKMDINNYPLTNIKTNARFASEFFEGDLEIDDPNLKLKASGSVDLRDDKNVINVKAQLDTLVADKLNLLPVPSSFSSYIEIDGSGLVIDSIRGNLRLENLHALYDSNYLEIKKLELVSKFDNTSRSLNINSDRISVDITGKYDYSVVYSDILTLIKEYKLNLKNETSDIKEYYSTKVIDPTKKYQFDINLNLPNVNPIINLFAPEIQVSKNLSAQGSFSQGYTSILAFSTEFDSLRIGNEYFVDNIIELNASKIADSSNVLASVYLSSNGQLYSNNAKSENLRTEAIWDRNQIDFNISVEQQGLENYANIYGELVFLPDLTVIKFKPSDLQALNEKWVIEKDNTITLAGKEIGFMNLGISNAEQEIMMNGLLSENPQEALTLELKNVELSNFDPITTKQFRGSSSGFLQIKNYYQDILFETNLNIYNFLINNFLIGDISNLSRWDNIEKKFDLKFGVQRGTNKIIDISGDYYPGMEDGLNLDAEFLQADMKILEPFIAEAFSDFQGFVTGSFAIKGNLRKPDFSGKGKLVNGGAKINYLNTFYTFNADLELKDNEIGVRNALVRDRNGSLAFFNGGFFLEGLEKISMNFEGSFNDFLALNTSVNDNDLFYGTGRGTGTISISGYTQNLKIDVKATTNTGTRIFIPLGGSSQVDQEEYIRFVNISEADDKAEEALNNATTELTGLDFTLDLQITPDAYAEMIFDIKVGDIIRGRGNGDLKFNISPIGEFSMFGDFQFTEGGYNFTLYNIVNKEFSILPDSKITWLGDPYGGTVDINAAYVQLASIGPLLDTAYRSANEVKRRYPTKVILDLTGPLLTPDIKFDIEIEDYPKSFYSNGQNVNLDTELSAVRAEWDINEQELQKQVFSLIVLRTFSEESFDTGGSVGSSVSEFVSNQLSYWISQVDENLEIDISLGDLSGEAYNTFQLRLSYTFLDGRLRVTRDGGITNSVSQAVAASVIGDWSVEYLLTDNGNLRVKLFQKVDYNSIDNSFSSDNSTLKGGFSLIYTQSYDDIKEIFETARKTKNNEVPDDLTSQMPENPPIKQITDDSGNN